MSGSLYTYPSDLTWQDMRFPPAIIDALAKKGIQRPTPIQIQAIPAALTGRDVIGIAFTGSGKTMVRTGGILGLCHLDAKEQ